MPVRYHRCNPIDTSTSAESLGFCGREGFIIQLRCCSAEQARRRWHGLSLRCCGGSTDVSPISLSGWTSRIIRLGDCKIGIHQTVQSKCSQTSEMLLLLTSARLAMQVELPLDKGVVLLDVAFTENDPNHGQKQCHSR